ncbi:uncharacterized protein LOC108666024 [Hyalella azteca]|uniref:Uncharacterized protein LOC108666024 n=1 Tax=Hyalella azteca TaxID=294128 RepID=A0A8B7N3B0_HYAAZ|nr:uncharacterized protein LOC108666024 [Hyalella azteca]
MTIILPPREESLNGQDIVPYTLERSVNCSEGKMGPNNGKVSSLNSLPVIEMNVSNYTGLSLFADAKPAVGSLWYRYCQAIRDDEHSLDSRGEAQAIPWSRSSSFDQESIEDGLLPGELSVKGFYVDPAIVPGFKYVVRLADSDKLLFNGKALKLVSIGRGYGKRITFESDSAICNEHYFYSDTHSAGYGFRLVAVEQGAKFTLKDGCGNAMGFATVIETLEEMEECHEVTSLKQVQKLVKVTLLCNVENLKDFGGYEQKTVEGTAVLLREKASGPAVLEEIINCSIESENVHFTLVPGVDEKERIFFVSSNQGDIPASFIVTGLLPHELPVIGTFVHPNIIVGAKYKVRNLESGKYLFDGRAMTLQSIGRGYGKRITFASESHIHNDNYFYSDTNCGGFGFTIEALSVGDHFRIVDTNTAEDVGVAEVFRTDVPQRPLASSSPGLGRVHVEVTCNVTRMGETCTMRVSGTAIIEKHRSGMSVSVSDVTMRALQPPNPSQTFLFLPV